MKRWASDSLEFNKMLIQHGITTEIRESLEFMYIGTITFADKDAMMAALTSGKMDMFFNEFSIPMYGFISSPYDFEIYGKFYEKDVTNYTAVCQQVPIVWQTLTRRMNN